MTKAPKILSSFCRIRFLTITIISFFIAFKLASAQGNSALNRKNYRYFPRIESDNKFSIKRQIRDHKLLIPIYQNQEGDWLLFTDLRGGFDNLGSSQYNAAIGYRKLINDTIILDQKQWIIGFYGSLDRLLSKYHHVFLQAMFGAELLSDDYDFRVNIYLPQNKEMIIEDLSYIPELQRSKLGVTYVKEKPLKGADIEFGYKLPFDFVQSKLFAGGYYFKGDGYPSISGPKIRSEIYFDRGNIKFLPKALNLTFGFEYQYDQTRKEQIFGLAKISYKFGSDWRSDHQLKNRMTDFVVRDVDIVTNKRQFFDDALYDGSNRLGKIYIISADDDLVAAINEAGQDSAIILDGTKGSFILESSVNLKSGQKLIGGGFDIIFQTAKFPQATFRYGLNKVRAEINAISNQNEEYLIKLNNDSLIENLDFNISAKAKSQSQSKQQITKVIYIQNVENIVIKNISLKATNNEDIYKSYEKLSAIEIANSNHVEIKNDQNQKENLIAGYGNGMLILGASDLNIEGLNFRQNHVAAVNVSDGDLDSKSYNIKIDNSEFDDNKNAIMIGKDRGLAIKEAENIISGLTIANSHINNSEQKAIIINYAKNVILDNIYVDGIKSHSAGSTAVAINYSADVKINNSRIIAGSEDGLLYGHGSQDLIINDLSISGISKNAIHVKNFYGSIIINNSVTEVLNGARGLFVNHDGNVISNQLYRPSIGGQNNNFGACKYIGNSRASGYFTVDLGSSFGDGCSQ